MIEFSLFLMIFIGAVVVFVLAASLGAFLVESLDQIEDKIEENLKADSEKDSKEDASQDDIENKVVFEAEDELDESRRSGVAIGAGAVLVAVAAGVVAAHFLKKK